MPIRGPDCVPFDTMARPHSEAQRGSVRPAAAMRSTHREMRYSAAVQAEEFGGVDAYGAGDAPRLAMASALCPGCAGLSDLRSRLKETYRRRLFHDMRELRPAHPAAGHAGGCKKAAGGREGSGGGEPVVFG